MVMARPPQKIIIKDVNWKTQVNCLYRSCSDEICRLVLGFMPVSSPLKYLSYDNRITRNNRYKTRTQTETWMSTHHREKLLWASHPTPPQGTSYKCESHESPKQGKRGTFLSSSKLLTFQETLHRCQFPPGWREKYLCGRKLLLSSLMLAWTITAPTLPL